MAERKGGQEKGEAERKAHQYDLHKIMKEMMDAKQAKAEPRLKEIKHEIKEDMKNDRKERMTCQKFTMRSEVE
jgi:hypothetical protein